MINNKPIKLIKSSFYKENKIKNKLVKFILNSKSFSMGEQCKKFENNFAKKQGRKYAVFVSSGSSANLVLIQALLNIGRIKKGDPIGFSALTWSTNVMPLIQLGLNPIALDCNKKTLCVPPGEIIKNIKNLKGLFITNVLGFSDNIKEIKKICHKNNIIFIEDNCESLGSKMGGKLLGNFGIASTFSFFVGHHLSTIEGGMICTDDRELYNMLLLTRIHGCDRNIDLDTQKKLRKKNNIDDFYAKYTFYDLAYNARPNEINGLIGNYQIKLWDKIISRREKNFQLFNNIISKNDDLIPLKLSHMSFVSNFAMPIICRNKEVFKKYKERFLNNNVEIRPIIAGNIENQPFYKKYIRVNHRCLNADFIEKNGFYFGNNPEMTKQELVLICSLLKK